jgi:hypothetical protein
LPNRDTLFLCKPDETILPIGNFLQFHVLESLILPFELLVGRPGSTSNIASHKTQAIDAAYYEPIRNIIPRSLQSLVVDTWKDGTLGCPLETIISSTLPINTDRAVSLRKMAFVHKDMDLAGALALNSLAMESMFQEHGVEFDYAIFNTRPFIGTSWSTRSSSHTPFRADAYSEHEDTCCILVTNYKPDFTTVYSPNPHRIDALATTQATALSQINGYSAAELISHFTVIAEVLQVCEHLTRRVELAVEQGEDWRPTPETVLEPEYQQIR